MAKPAINEKYAVLKKVHSLPDFDKLNHEFEISTIEHEDFLLIGIVRKIACRIEDFTKYLEKLLQPETSIGDMYESRFFDDAEKKEIFRIYKTLMSWQRKAVLLEIEHDDKKSAEFISSFFNGWAKMKTDLVKIFKKTEECWKKEEDSKTDLGYMG